jgi:hypothetical protein
VEPDDGGGLPATVALGVLKILLPDTRNWIQVIPQSISVLKPLDSSGARVLALGRSNSLLRTFCAK